MKRSAFIFFALTASSLFLRSAPASGSQTAVPEAVGREERIAYLKKSAVPVRSIDAEDTDFSDLEPLRRVIGNRRIVMLGEATHGDGAAFAAKVHLIKFLHERLDFDLLALEAGFYDVRRAWAALRAGEDPLATMRASVFVEWAEAPQVQPLWRYVVDRLKTNRPLELAGFDLQFTGGVSRKYFVKDLNDYLAKAGVLPGAAPLVARVSDPLNRLMEDLGSFHDIRLEDRASIRTAMDELVRALERIGPLSGPDAAERAYWIQLLKSSAVMLELGWSIDLYMLGKRPVDVGVFNLRDRQMAENLVWLANEAHPARKIIVWSATGHIMRNRAAFGNEDEPMISMGDRIEKALGPEVYTLGFTAYRGRWGSVAMPRPLEVEAAPENGLEDLLFKAGFEFAWLDFRNPGAGGLWLREPLSGRLLGHEPRTLDWTQIVDGVFFIREMFPGARIETK